FLPLVDGLEGVGHDRVVHLAQVGDLHVLEGREAADQVPAPAADAHDGELNAFVGLLGRPEGGAGREGGGGGGAEELAPVERGHGWTSPGERGMGRGYTA